MKRPKITIQETSLKLEPNDSYYDTLKKIDKQLVAINKEYTECQCAKCKIVVINKADDIVSAEIYKWYEILQGPISSPNEIESETIDEAVMQIATLQEILNSFNDLRKELLNSPNP